MTKLVKFEYLPYIFFSLAIISYIIRFFSYSWIFLGYFPDLFWGLSATTFIISEFYNRFSIITIFVITLIVPIVGIGSEVLQWFLEINGIGWGGYYPGTADILDALAFIFARIISWIVFYIFLKLERL